MFSGGFSGHIQRGLEGAVSFALGGLRSVARVFACIEFRHGIEFPLFFRIEMVLSVCFHPTLRIAKIAEIAKIDNSKPADRPNLRKRRHREENPFAADLRRRARMGTEPTAETRKHGEEPGNAEERVADIAFYRRQIASPRQHLVDT
jgi:hypothetical protein